MKANQIRSILFFFLINFIFSNNAVSQNKKIVIIIDSIVDFVDTNLFYLNQSWEKVEYLPVKLDKLKFSKKAPYLTTELEIIDSLSYIQLVFDEKGSYIQFNNLYNYKFDSLKIEKISFIKNCLCDSIYKSYFEKDIKSNTSKTKFSKNKIDKKCINKSNLSYTLKINGEIYQIPLKIIEESNKVTLFDGVKPKRKKENNKPEKKSFWGEIRTFFYIYCGETEIK